MNQNTELLIEVLVSTGILTALGETVRWWLGRGHQKVDNARIVQGMAIDLLKPMHAELTEANASIASLRSQMHDLEAEFESVLAWAVYARSVLDSHAIPYSPVPAAVRTGP